METRACKYCGAVKPIRCFPVALTLGAKVYRRRKCDARYAAMKYNHRRDVCRWFDRVKSSFVCQQCGNSDYRVLEFHHARGGTKESAVADMVRSGYSQERILAEAAKCDTLCANCRRILHWEARQDRV